MRCASSVWVAAGNLVYHHVLETMQWLFDLRREASASVLRGGASFLHLFADIDVLVVDVVHKRKDGLELLLRAGRFSSPWICEQCGVLQSAPWPVELQDDTVEMVRIDAEERVGKDGDVPRRLLVRLAYTYPRTVGDGPDPAVSLPPSAGPSRSTCTCPPPASACARSPR